MEENRARESKMKEIGKEERDRDKTKEVNKGGMLGRVSDISEEDRKGKDRRGNYGNVEEMLLEMKRKREDEEEVSKVR